MPFSKVDLSLGGLIDRPAAVFDAACIAAQIDALAQAARDGADLRAQAVALLSEANAKGRAVIARALESNPYQAPSATRAYAWLTDGIVCEILRLAETWLHPRPNPTRAEQLAVLAVGGYGRAEMAPFSDVDLLFLTPYKQTPWGESLIESVLYTLWDLKLKVGHATRTLDECLRLARDDISIRTALLEHRYLHGARELADGLEARMWQELIRTSAPDFIEAKLEERDRRHARHGGARYVVEPNVKEGKGGLRDLQTLFWIGKYVNRVSSPADLVKAGLLSQVEYDTFARAEAFLWTVRVHLHLIAGRAQEQLTFDVQVELAARLGFADRDGMRGVEWFMQSYFTEARAVGELTRIFLTGLEARHVKRFPAMGRALRSALRFGRWSGDSAYRLMQGRLAVCNPDEFVADPLNFIRLFQEALRSDILIHPDAMRLVARNLHLIDDDFRANPEANRIFLELLLSHNNPERALRRMNELGFLGAFVPQFGRIVALMQFNMYHSYTVDEHTIRCVSTLFQIERGELVEDLPVASGILRRGVNRKVIYVAVLLHDIGKGLPGDHSERGAEIAAELCPRLGLEPQECEAVVWLVRNHLLMSDVAQKRDVHDPRTVRDFVGAVQSVSRLNLLCVLTVCDIRGVGPNTWNNWKAVLLRELYALSVDELTGGAQASSQPQREQAAQAALAERLQGWSAEEIATEMSRHYTPYWLGLDTDTQAIFANLLRHVEGQELASSIEPDSSRDATRACFAIPDHPGLFARLAGALALAGANVVDARTYTSSDGMATAVFWIQDSEGAPFEASRLPRLRRTILRTLKGEIVARAELDSRSRIRKRERDFQVPTTITFDNQGSEIYTIIEVDTRDRLGLLHDLARTLTECNVSIASAIIATFGEQAVDTFYVKDLFGLKLHSEAKRKSVETRLRAAITRGMEDAGA